MRAPRGATMEMEIRLGGGGGGAFGRGWWTQLGGPQGWLTGKKIKLGWLKNF
jgi:hypothetical protein